MAQAIILFSGGLDSRLVVKMLQEQNIDILALHFNIPFFGSYKLEEISKFAEVNNIKLKIIEFTKGKEFNNYIKLLRKPKHGYGSGMNPCIDCHIFMLKKAKQIMLNEKADFIATGEVLNERPMSQHLKALMLIEKEAGLKGKLLRPLSAKLLPKTIAEEKGLVDRDKLFDINGRKRDRQIELAKKYNIDYPSPGGGCLLCEKEFAVKINNLFEHQKKIIPKDTELLKIGRHFRFNNTKIIVGRNKEENEKIMQLAGKDIIMETKDIPSPITLIMGKADKETIKTAASLTIRYSNINEGIAVYGKGKFEKEIKSKAMIEKEIEKLKI